MLPLGFLWRLGPHQGLINHSLDGLGCAAARARARRVVGVSLDLDSRSVVVATRRRAAGAAGRVGTGFAVGDYGRVVDADVAACDNLALGDVFAFAVRDDTVERVWVNAGWWTKLVEREAN
jgi:hypothetical protein